MFELRAEKQAHDTGHHCRREARPAPRSGLSLGQGAEDRFSWGENALRPIGAAPIAALQRPAFSVHRPDGQHGWHGGRDMQTGTSLISGSCHD